jgi:hypothetical protein
MFSPCIDPEHLLHVPPCVPLLSGHGDVAAAHLALILLILLLISANLVLIPAGGGVGVLEHGRHVLQRRRHLHVLVPQHPRLHTCSHLMRVPNYVPAAPASAPPPASAQARLTRVDTPSHPHTGCEARGAKHIPSVPNRGLQPDDSVQEAKQRLGSRRAKHVQKEMHSS